MGEQGVGSSSGQPPSPRHGWFAPPPSGKDVKRPPKPPCSDLPAAPAKGLAVPPLPPLAETVPALAACPPETVDSSGNRLKVSRPQPATMPSAQNPAASTTVRTEFEGDSRVTPGIYHFFAEFSWSACSFRA